MPRQKPKAKRPSEVFVERLKEVRERRRWSQRDFCAQLEAVGHSTDPATIARTEGGKRGISLDDAVAYSAVLGPSLANMIIPNHSDIPFAVAPGFHVPPRLARQWIRSQAALRAEDARTAFSEVSDEEFFIQQERHLSLVLLTVQELVDAVVADDKERAADVIDALNAALDRQRDALATRGGKG